MNTRMTKASIQSLVDSCIDLMAERDKENENVKDELLFEVDTIEDLYTVFGYIMQSYGEYIKTAKDVPLIETWDLNDGKTTTAQFQLYDDFWVSISHSASWDDGLCELMDGCMIVDLRGFDTAEVL
jgi:hypothetical protein